MFWIVILNIWSTLTEFIFNNVLFVQFKSQRKGITRAYQGFAIFGKNQVRN